MMYRKCTVVIATNQVIWPEPVLVYCPKTKSSLGPNKLFDCQSKHGCRLNCRPHHYLILLWIMTEVFMEPVVPELSQNLFCLPEYPWEPRVEFGCANSTGVYVRIYYLMIHRKLPKAGVGLEFPWKPQQAEPERFLFYRSSW